VSGDPLRLGLIGAGRWGRNYINTITALDGVRLAELSSTNPQSAQFVPNDCRVSSDWRSILDAGLIDGLIVATPPELHVEMVRAAVQAGLPVLVEKPLSLDAMETGSLRALVIEHNGFVMVGHTHLFHPAFRKLKAIAPKFGKIRSITGEAGNYGPFRPDTPVLWDWGAHDVAMCLDLLACSPDEAEGFLADCRRVPEGLGEVVELDLKFPDDVRAHIRVGNILPKRRHFRVDMETAALVYDDLSPSPLSILLSTGSDAPTPVEVALEKPLTMLVKEFAAAIREGRRDTLSLDLGIEVVDVLRRCATNLRR
jgi:predicted dehydrogenase